METYQLSIKEVADMVGASEYTINSWRSNNDNEMPDYRLELLELKLKLASGEY
jgi:DNA-binding XRE family transcriptional regulator